MSYLLSRIKRIMEKATVTHGTHRTLLLEQGAKLDFIRHLEHPPNNVFALELDSDSPLVNDGSSFTYSSAMIYEADQSPCIPPVIKVAGSYPHQDKHLSCSS